MSVRALHHYDEIGLLSPSLRTPSGHRLYQQADIARLQQIQSLRLMGIPLEEVKRLLDGAAMSPREVIDLHLARLHEQIAAAEQPGRAPASAGASHLDMVESASIDDLCRIIQVTTAMEKYFTTEQLEVLRDRRTSISEEHMHEVRDSWNEIIPRVRNAMEADVDPASPEMFVDRAALEGARWRSSRAAIRRSRRPWRQCTSTRARRFRPTSERFRRRKCSRTWQGLRGARSNS